MNQICYTWGNAGVKWSEANWPWSSCAPVVTQSCAIWSTTPFLWKDAAWFWVQCGNTGPQPQPTASIVVVPGQLLGVDATTLIQPWIIEPWNPYRAGEIKKKRIKLICKVKGVTFEQEKEVEDRTLSVNSVKMEVGTFSNIDLDVRLEE